MTITEGEGTPFPEMEVSARQAASEFRNAPVGGSSDGPAAPGSLVEEYRKQLDLNHEAHRHMRWAAFLGLGSLIALFLFVLLITMVELLDREFILKLVDSGSKLNWHILVFAGVVVAAFTAIPLSLAIALVKMISLSQHDSEDGAYKTPTTELGKVVLDLLKSVAQAAKSN